MIEKAIAFSGDMLMIYAVDKKHIIVEARKRKQLKYTLV